MCTEIAADLFVRYDSACFHVVDPGLNGVTVFLFVESLHGAMVQRCVGKDVNLLVLLILQFDAAGLLSESLSQIV